MGYSYINRVERLARWICKSLKPGTEIETSEVYRLIAEFDRRQARESRVGRQQVRKDVEGLSEALQLAVSKGWLAERDGQLSITESGASLARRSRAAPRKRRVSF